MEEKDKIEKPQELPKEPIKEEPVAELKELKGVEIFQVGTHNGDKYTDADLDELVKGFKAIGDKVKPFVKIGHSETQKLLEKDGLPAAGWITNLYKKGNKLIADISDMPKKIFELIKNKAYKRVSSEIYWNYKDESGKKYPRILRAIALLGAETPAVQTLDDIMALYGNTEPICYNDENQDIHTYEWEEIKMDEIKKYEEKLVELELKLKESEDQKAQTEEKIAKMELESKKILVNIKLDDAIKNKKILPAQRDFYFGLYMDQFKIGEKTYTKEELVDEIVKSNLDITLNTENTEKGDEINNEESLADSAEKYAEENKVSYKDALIHLSMNRKGE